MLALLSYRRNSSSHKMRAVRCPRKCLKEKEERPEVSIGRKSRDIGTEYAAKVMLNFPTSYTVVLIVL
jgi:hypothetical protein